VSCAESPSFRSANSVLPTNATPLEDQQDHELIAGLALDATFVITGLLIVIFAIAVRDQLPRRRASSFAIMLLGLPGVALIGRLQGRHSDAERRESRDLARLDPRDRVPVDHCDGCARATDNARRPKLGSFRSPLPIHPPLINSIPVPLSEPAPGQLGPWEDNKTPPAA
jgi:hypothetical protein